MATFSASSLLLNVAPIEFMDASIKGFKLAVKSPEGFRSLRDEYAGRCLVRRKGELNALVIPLIPDVTVDGFPIELGLQENLGIVAGLVGNALTDYLYGIGRVISRGRPITFLDSKTDLLDGAVSPSKLNSAPISIRPAFVLEPRVFQFESAAPFVGVAISMRVVKSIEDNAADLLQRGLDLTGLYAGRRVKERDSRITSRLLTIGRVLRVEGDELVLEDHREGEDRILANKAFVEASQDAIGRILSCAFQKDAQAIRTRLFHAENELHGGLNKHSRVQQICGFFQKLSLELVPGIPFSIKPFLTDLPPVETCSKPTYVFDPTGRQTKTWHDGGLTEYGPYTRQTFTPSKPRICIICQRQKRGRIEQFVQKFLHGIPLNSGKRAAFPNGLLGKYRLENCTASFFEVDGQSAEDYKKASLHAIQESTDEGFRWDLALVQVEEDFKVLLGDSSPYFTTKSIFLTHQIPVQDFRTETTVLPPSQLQYVLNNMALATYAKMGGIPWLLEANPTIAHELVIGIGSAQLNRGRFGESTRIVGITTVFSGDGKYRLSNVSTAVPLEKYGTALLDSLRETVNRIRVEMNWQSGDHVRLVFHAFKPMKNIEAEAVKQTMQGLGDFDLDYAFLHIAEDHPLMLFDTSQKGVLDYETKRTKGAFAPNRGMFMHLSENDTLVTLVGPNEVKTSRQGIPSPIILKLHPTSSFRDMTYLARQVVLFASHSWRSFFPAELPVTIKYSDMIARLLGNLETLSNWNPEVMVGRIANTRWFL